MTPVVKCVPPHHKPLREEYLNCSRYLLREFELLTNLRAVLALGRFAFEAFLSLMRRQGNVIPHLDFKHGSRYPLGERLPAIYCSYHPSPQNTFTGKLTSKMFLNVLRQIKRDCQAP
jgi:uracil-DNA glycosylase